MAVIYYKIIRQYKSKLYNDNVFTYRCEIMSYFKKNARLGREIRHNELYTSNIVYKNYGKRIVIYSLLSMGDYFIIYKKKYFFFLYNYL
jgi:hypothetical protein